MTCSMPSATQISTRCSDITVGEGPEQRTEIIVRLFAGRNDSVGPPLAGHWMPGVKGEHVRGNYQDDHEMQAIWTI